MIFISYLAPGIKNILKKMVWKHMNAVFDLIKDKIPVLPKHWDRCKYGLTRLYGSWGPGSNKEIAFVNLVCISLYTATPCTTKI
jgi:hypothetical protein